MCVKTALSRQVNPYLSACTTSRVLEDPVSKGPGTKVFIRDTLAPLLVSVTSYKLRLGDSPGLKRSQKREIFNEETLPCQELAFIQCFKTWPSSSHLLLHSAV